MQFATRFRYVAQEVRSLLIDGSAGGLPGSKGTRSVKRTALLALGADGGVATRQLLLQRLRPSGG